MFLASRLCSSKTDIAETLKEALLAGREEGRLTCGVYESGELLET